jgi:uncharacterized protein YjbJ (UPF0337 family)
MDRWQIALLLHSFQHSPIAGTAPAYYIKSGVFYFHDTPFFNSYQGMFMNKDQVKGRVDQVKGKATELAGKLTDNEKMKSEGKADQISGKVQAGYGDAKENIKTNAKKIIDKI